MGWFQAMHRHHLSRCYAFGTSNRATANVPTRFRVIETNPLSCLQPACSDFILDCNI